MPMTRRYIPHEKNIMIPIIINMNEDGPRIEKIDGCGSSSIEYGTRMVELKLFLNIM